MADEPTNLIAFNMPNREATKLLENLLDAARSGDLQSLGIVAKKHSSDGGVSFAYGDAPNLVLQLDILKYRIVASMEAKQAPMGGGG